MSKYFEMFGYLARYFEDDVELLRQNFREVPTSTLLQLALYRLLLSSGNIHEMLKYALEHLKLYERGYVLQGVLAAREETGETTGVVFTFAASGISGSLVDTVTLHIGVYVRFGDKSKYFSTGGVLTASVFIADGSPPFMAGVLHPLGLPSLFRAPHGCCITCSAPAVSSGEARAHRLLNSPIPNTKNKYYNKSYISLPHTYPP
jgi:hypothetical protein